ncbi:DUF5791 family protein [Halovivax sp.]|uniref:DUF5791 family protein n=1 Tax=Halovivax sp. TaxID=1935978 RepID=UPI0025BDB1EE|nr:DUF5791 family protein [Halovivax sp.]
MFYEQRMSVPETPVDLRAEYDDALASVVREVGVTAAESGTDVDSETLESLAAGESPPLSVREAAEILALQDGEPDGETIVVEACEHLLLGMSTAVLDVETLASHVALDLDPKEIQQKIERRAPMSFDEYVHLQHAIADRAP